MITRVHICCFRKKIFIDMRSAAKKPTHTKKIYINIFMTTKYINFMHIHKNDFYHMSYTYCINISMIPGNVFLRISLMIF